MVGLPPDRMPIPYPSNGQRCRRSSRVPWIQRITGFAVGKEIHVPIEHHPVFIQIKIGMGYVAEEGTAGIVRAREVIAIVKEPSCPGVGGEILVGERAAPPTGILDRLKAGCHQRIGISLFDSAAIERSITLIFRRQLNLSSTPVNAEGPSHSDSLIHPFGAIRKKF